MIMNIGPRFLALATLICAVVTGTPLTAQQRTYTTEKPSIIYSDKVRAGQKAGTYQVQPRTGYRKSVGRPIKSRYNKGLSLAAIRAGAIRQTLADLERLRPYTTNFNALRSAIRRYWQRNITRPTTRGLAGTIMRHVKGFYKGLVRGQVYAGSAAGIVKVKKALRNRRR